MTTAVFVMGVPCDKSTGPLFISRFVAKRHCIICIIYIYTHTHTHTHIFSNSYNLQSSPHKIYIMYKTHCQFRLWKAVYNYSYKLEGPMLTYYFMFFLSSSRKMLGYYLKKSTTVRFHIFSDLPFACVLPFDIIERMQLKKNR
jgi:hypothetical protein